LFCGFRFFSLFPKNNFWSETSNTANFVEAKKMLILYNPSSIKFGESN